MSMLAEVRAMTASTNSNVLVARHTLMAARRETWTHWVQQFDLGRSLARVEDSMKRHNPLAGWGVLAQGRAALMLA
jgi:hypothetical protein